MSSKSILSIALEVIVSDVAKNLGTLHEVGSGSGLGLGLGLGIGLEFGFGYVLG